MHLWRICAAKYQDSAFSGLGGLYVSGRWHQRGNKIIYTAESLALATLEIFVHLESDRLPLVAIKANVEEKLAVEEVKNFPLNWQETTAYPELQKIGTEWLKSCRTPILKVPSAIVPVEFNYLLNPDHPDLELSKMSPLNYQLDRRLWKN